MVQRFLSHIITAAIITNIPLLLLVWYVSSLQFSTSSVGSFTFLFPRYLR
jgi:hypothetical protein